MRLFISFISLLLSVIVSFANDTSVLDMQKPFGYCTCTSRTEATMTFDVTGGGCYTYPIPTDINYVVIQSDGGDMRETITNAIKRHRVIVLDGSKGDFIISKAISISAINDRTILGINGATLRTEWHMTDEIKQLLDKAGVPAMSGGAGTGGTMTNGQVVNEECEYHTRQILYDYYGNENYRNSGILALNHCSNFIIRNIMFAGPGSVDVSGSDLLSLIHTTNTWVDHCEFIDGIDGNLDITVDSDCNTVTWCRFRYTSLSYMHSLSNLIGGSESEAEGKLNTTLAFNHWSTGCKGRMPMARCGIIHSLNNLFDCAGCGQSINANYHSSLLVEGNYFDVGVKKIFSSKNADNIIWTESNVVSEKVAPPSNVGSISVPYEHSVVDALTIRDEVKAFAGPILYNNVESIPSPPDVITPTDITLDTNVYIIDGADIPPFDGQNVFCNDITLTYGNDGEWQEPRYLSIAPEGYTCAVYGNVNPVDEKGSLYSTAKRNVPTKGTYYIFKPKTDGTLELGLTVYRNKQLFVCEDGIAIDIKANGSVISSGTPLDTDNTTSAIINFNVKGGKTYHIFGIASKIQFYGFRFQPAAPTSIITPSYTTSDDKVYTIDGRLASTSSKGIIINNKRKFIKQTISHGKIRK